MPHEQEPLFPSQSSSEHLTTYKTSSLSPAMQRTNSQTQVPTASMGRMLLAPFARLFRTLRIPVPTNMATTAANPLSALVARIIVGLKRLDRSMDPRKTLSTLQKHPLTIHNTALWVGLVLLACVNLYIMDSRLLKAVIPTAYIAAIIIPATSQFFFPATPVLMWVLTFFCARYIPSSWRPNIHVVLLPTLESVLYGANISDLLTRYTHPVLDVLAWLPYGVGHFAIPGIIALVLWLFAPKGSAQFFGKAFGFMNLVGVLCQIFFPCAAPWYEIIHGLVPANYSMPGSPGGLMRIDRIFGTKGYTNTFGSAPLVFGAFPSLHSGCATMDALFLTHFFPKYRYAYWTYVGVLYWSTMYLTHHYLIDVVGGGCLALASFFYFMPKEFKDLATGIDWDNEATHGANYGQLDDSEADLDLDEEIRQLDGNRADTDAKAPTSESAEIDRTRDRGPRGDSQIV